jgi:hypothetical protein
MPELPEWIEIIIIKTMAKLPDQRFANADELIEALDAGQGGTEATAIRPIDTPALAPRSGVMRGELPLGTTELGTRRPIDLLSVLTPILVIVGVAVMIAIVLGQGGNGPFAGFFATEVAVVDPPTATYTDTPTATFTDTPSPTPTDTPTTTPTNTPTDTPTTTPTNTPTDTPTTTPTDTPTNTPTDTPTPTLTDTPTVTFTPTDTLTPTPSNTPSQTPNVTETARVEATQIAVIAASQTAQAQIDFFATQRAITPTQDVQRVLESCDLEYVILAPEDLSIPPLANQPNPRLIRNAQEFTLEVEIQNTSTCDWPAGLIFLSFVDDAETDISEFDDSCDSGRAFNDVNLTEPEIDNIRINETVEQGQRLTLELEARSGARFGCYFGTWELRIPDYNLFIGDPFIISYRGFGGQ